MYGLTLTCAVPAMGHYKVGEVRWNVCCQEKDKGGAHPPKARTKAHGGSRAEPYQAPPLLLAPGDTLLMASDGITEARSKGREYLGYEGMVALAEGAVAAASPTLRHLGHAILDGARAFAGGSLHDDACLLLARRA